MAAVRVSRQERRAWLSGRELARREGKFRLRAGPRLGQGAALESMVAQG